MEKHEATIPQKKLEADDGEKQITEESDAFNLKADFIYAASKNTTELLTLKISRRQTMLHEYNLSYQFFRIKCFRVVL
jgi:hypothetical protein